MHKAVGDGVVFDNDARAMKGVVLIRVWGRHILDKIGKFNKILEPY